MNLQMKSEDQVRKEMPEFTSQFFDGNHTKYFLAEANAFEQEKGISMRECRRKLTMKVIICGFHGLLKENHADMENVRIFSSSTIIQILPDSA